MTSRLLNLLYTYMTSCPINPNLHDLHDIVLLTLAYTYKISPINSGLHLHDIAINPDLHLLTALLTLACTYMTSCY
jgi:hypothetical protein